MKETSNIESIYPITLKDLEKKVRGAIIRNGHNAKSRTEKRSDYIQKGIKYKLPDGKKLAKQMKQNHPDLYNKMFEQKKLQLYLHNEKRYSPTFHRLEKHYEWGKIDIIPHYQHTKEDNAKPVVAYDLLKQVKYEFDSMTDASKWLGYCVDVVSKYTGSGRIMRTRSKGNYLIEALNENKQGKSKNKINSEQRFSRITFTATVDELDQEGNVLQSYKRNFDIRGDFKVGDAGIRILQLEKKPSNLAV